MFNAFTNPMQINDIRFLAYAVNAISSQQSVGDFCLNYNFANTTFVTKDDSTKPFSKHNARYDAVRTWIRQPYPDMHTSHGVSERYYESDRGTLITEKEDCLHNITEKWGFDRSGILLKYEKKMPDGATQLLINDKDNPFSKQEIAFLPVNK